MDKIDKKTFLEPAEFSFNDAFLSGFDSEIRYDKFEVINDVDFAMNLSIDQIPPKGYLVWQDAIDNAVSDFRMSAAYSEADSILMEIDERFSDYQNKKSIQYRKNKLKKNNSKREDFYFNISGDAYYQLRSTSIQRYVDGYKEDSFLESVFLAYVLGGYPCGVKRDKKIVVYNPSALIG